VYFSVKNRLNPFLSDTRPIAPFFRFDGIMTEKIKIEKKTNCIKQNMQLVHSFDHTIISYQNLSQNKTPAIFAGVLYII